MNNLVCVRHAFGQFLVTVVLSVRDEADRLRNAVYVDQLGVDIIMGAAIAKLIPVAMHPILFFVARVDRINIVLIAAVDRFEAHDLLGP